MQDGAQKNVDLAGGDQFVARPNWLIILMIGLFLGALAVPMQVKVLRFGSLSPGQLTVLVGWFVALGAMIAATGGFIGFLVAKKRGTAYGLALLLTVAFFLVFSNWNARRMPNVYLLVTDTTRSDHLSVYGYEKPTTPFLEEFAAESVIFQNAASTGTHTIVSTPSIVASCYPSQHGIVSYSNVLSNRFTLISEYLSEWGYETYGYATNPHLGPRHGYSQGFDSYEHDPGWAHTSAAQVNAKFLQWMDDTSRGDGPYFGFLFYIDPHNPYSPPPAYQKLFDPEWSGPPVSDWKHELGRPDDATLANMIAQYDGAIAHWDSEMRKLAADLDERGVWDNSLLVYTSDHGEEFYEHGFWGHNKIVYEGSAGVPLVFSFPVPVKFPSMGRVSAVVEEVASIVDIVPTILEYVRIDPDDLVMGRSVVPCVFGGDDGPERIAYYEEILQRYGPYDIRGIRTKTHKYIKVINFEGDLDHGDLFFDLVEDPGEQRNLIDSRPDEARFHRRILDMKMAEVTGSGATEVDTVEIDRAQLERLKALGYIGND